jgi:Domain of unknown function (DUF4915)
VLVVSGLGAESGGGLYALTPGGRVQRLDARSTTGFAVEPGAAPRLARLLWTDDDVEAPGTLLVSDAAGGETAWTIDALREPHGVLWREGDGGLVVVSTLTNAILWLDPDRREVRRTWTADADEPGDAWHLNDLVVHDGRLLASAFGRFRTHRGWAADGARDGAGIVFDVATGADVLNGLTCPHDPTPLDGGWLVCDSASRRLLRLDAAGTVVQEVDLGGFTRGVAHDEEHVYVGISAHRLAGTEGRAAVVALARDTLVEVARWELPCEEAYGVGWLPAELAEAVRRRSAAGAVAGDGARALAEAEQREDAGDGRLRRLLRRVQPQRR